MYCLDYDECSGNSTGCKKCTNFPGFYKCEGCVDGFYWEKNTETCIGMNSYNPGQKC